MKTSLNTAYTPNLIHEQFQLDAQTPTPRETDSRWKMITGLFFATLLAIGGGLTVRSNQENVDSLEQNSPLTLHRETIWNQTRTILPLIAPPETLSVFRQNRKLLWMEELEKTTNMPPHTADVEIPTQTSSVDQAVSLVNLATLGALTALAGLFCWTQRRNLPDASLEAPIPATAKPSLSNQKKPTHSQSKLEVSQEKKEIVARINSLTNASHPQHKMEQGQIVEDYDPHPSLIPAHASDFPVTNTSDSDVDDDDFVNLNVTPEMDSNETVPTSHQDSNFWNVATSSLALIQTGAHAVETTAHSVRVMTNTARDIARAKLIGNPIKTHPDSAIQSDRLKVANPGLMLSSGALQAFLQGITTDHALNTIDVFYLRNLEDFTPFDLEKIIRDAKKNFRPDIPICIPIVFSNQRGGLFERNHIAVILIEEDILEYYDSKAPDLSEDGSHQEKVNQFISLCEKEFRPDGKGMHKIVNYNRHQLDAHNCGVLVARHIYRRLIERAPPGGADDRHIPTTRELDQFRRKICDIAYPIPNESVEEILNTNNYKQLQVSMS